MAGMSRTDPSGRRRLDEAEAQLRVARSPYATEAQRLERYLWAAFLAARHAREDPACFRACRILQRSAQGFLEAWHATRDDERTVRVFYVGGERFELRGRPEARPPVDGRIALRWAFSEHPAGVGRSVAVGLLERRREREPLGVLDFARPRPRGAVGSIAAA